VHISKNKKNRPCYNNESNRDSVETEIMKCTAAIRESDPHGDSVPTLMNMLSMSFESCFRFSPTIADYAHDHYRSRYSTLRHCLFAHPTGVRRARQWTSSPSLARHIDQAPPGPARVSTWDSLYLGRGRARRLFLYWRCVIRDRLTEGQWMRVWSIMLYKGRRRV
jgi:hypothetical protein